MQQLFNIIGKASETKSPVIVWLKGGEKIFGRVERFDNDFLTIEVTGAMSEFQVYKALILNDQIAAIAWVPSKD